ncbi:asparagine synthase (glutamine-hydrolyzing) [Pseudomonas orientalis]|uniref:asparagine synthase (glutamine-hydrolyzing) n=1 Tax=Pseudomonas orientalis TaxID=76758 RepID=UPI0034D658BC
MCGILGAYSYGGALPDQHEFESILTLMSSRGPDDSSSYFDKQIQLGHRRLILLDAEGGRQPFFHDDENIVVIYNGEIYNHPELRRQLEAQGVVFNGYSDGEVIGHLYRLHGEDFIQQVDGMFSIALYDRRESTLFLYRDRVGEKPLFYQDLNGILRFSSTLKPLLMTPAYKSALNPDGVANYFAQTQAGPISTLFQDIHKLAPAHYLKIDSGGRRLLRKYWSISYSSKLELPFREAAELIDEKLLSSVNSMLASDYPMGITLSGGIDSSLVLLNTMRAGSNPVQCHFLSSGSSHDPERSRAEYAAQAFGLDLIKFDVTQTSFDDLVTAMSHFDEPVGVYDSTYLLNHSAFISNHNRVALTGNGADEVFAGYNGYVSFLHNHSLNTQDDQDIKETLKRFLLEKHARDKTLLYTQTFSKCLERGKVEYAFDQIFRIADFSNLLDARTFYDIYFGMSHSASLSDTVGMAYGLEYRSPFFDRSLMETAAQLKPDYKICPSTMTTKPLLKDIAARHYSENLAYAKKLGCGHGIDRYRLLHTEWRLPFFEAFQRNEEVLQPIFCKDKVELLFNALGSGKLSDEDAHQLLKLAIFVAWVDAHKGIFHISR